MNGLAEDAITIDTNVFVHIFNDRENSDQHIDNLLERLMLDGVGLCVDEHGFINTEYDEKLEAQLRSADDTGNRRQLLQYWMAPETKRTVQVDRAGKVMKIIKKIIREPDENVDRMFVGVAVLADVVLVSNDDDHILIWMRKPRAEVEASATTRAERNQEALQSEKL